MARYRPVDMSPRFLPVVLEEQLVPGTFADAVHRLVDVLDLSAFDAHYRNDTGGAPAHAPGMLLKAVLLAYSQGIVSSRRIERACRDNVLFIAITGDAKPHFTTIADFVSRSRDAIAAVFAQVLAVLDKEGLIGREMFAIDGVKLPSNASKHRSGTRAEFLERAQTLEASAQRMLARHRSNDADGAERMEEKVASRIARMHREATRIRDWLATNPDDRMGASGNVCKSNLTDNASAKLATDKGVVQGYCAVAVVDAAHQVIVEASAHGTGSEHALLLPVLDACVDQRRTQTLILADAGYHSEANLAGLAEREIDALIADTQMRQRDPRFADRGKHTVKADALHGKSSKSAPRVFGTDRFIVSEDGSHAICPAGQRLHRNGKDCTIGDYHAMKFRAPIGACADCALRAQCLRKPTTRARQVSVLTRKTHAKHPHTQRMRKRIDSEDGRARYGQRLGTVEPVFGNLRYNKGLRRFTLRGQRKVDGQWKLFALVHNIEKWANCRKAA